MMDKKNAQGIKENKKKTLSITLDSDLAESFKQYLARLGTTNVSSGINIALRTFLLEREFLSRNHVPQNAILIPLSIYQDLTNYAYRYIEQSIFKNETKTVSIDNITYVALTKREEERFFHRFNEVLPVSNQIKNMQLLLERIAQKNGVRVFNPMRLFDKFQNDKNYKVFFLQQYVEVLKFFECMYAKNQDFFIANSKLEIMNIFSKNLNDGKPLSEEMNYFVEFIIDSYMTQEWSNE